MMRIVKKTNETVKAILERDKFVCEYKKSSDIKSKLILQYLIALSFLLLSFANVFAKSYFMLTLTLVGVVFNAVFAIISQKTNNEKICIITSVISCSIMFCFFVFYGGNDGFACLWVILLPLLSMVVMNFKIGITASLFFQIFLIIVFWTPVRFHLMYSYNDQFCLRFPLFFFVTFIMGLLLTISLRKSEYNECKHLIELEKITVSSHALARTDPLTGLANRRNAYEVFNEKFNEDGISRCVVMGDIDNFKKSNDSFGHEFGDDVLILFAELANDILPADYLKCRWGGEEFLFVANAPLADVYDYVEKLRTAFAEYDFMYNGEPQHITITFGIAEYKSKEELSKAISTADKRLYQGKKTTKNCTVAE